jgi:cytochrome c oxidase cbb3-type subunit 4
MDINDLRTIITALSFVVFAGIVFWAYSSRQRARFEEAANLPFADSDLPGELPVTHPLNSKENSNGVRS